VSPEAHSAETVMRHTGRGWRGGAAFVSHGFAVVVVGRWYLVFEPFFIRSCVSFFSLVI
jgi:hypothetical protein